jgi:integrase
MTELPKHSVQPRRVEGPDAVHLVVTSLPPLPPVFRYYDEFEDEHRSIKRPSETAVFEVWIYGQKIELDFGRFSDDVAVLLKHTFLFLLAKNRRISTIAGYSFAASYLSHEDFVDVLGAGPTGIGIRWKQLRGRNWDSHTYMLIKAVLRLMCEHRLVGWSNEYLDFLSSTLALPAKDKYAVVRAGDAFLSSAEEALIVRHLDEISASIKRNRDDNFLTPENIADAGMLLCAFQFAMRPVQIAMLTVGDLRIWEVSNDEAPSVHLTFTMAKQRGSSTRIPLTRRVKQDWAPIFLALGTQARERRLTSSARLFGVQSNHEAGSRISALLATIGCESRGSMNLRHTAAQRLVDAGANHDELSEFMGHTDVRTGLVYYDTSATQAERINRALGISPIYRAVAKIAHDRFISIDELRDLKDEQQIAGVPHGISIAGIGGCSSGQPACPYNPITSCYGCRKFMPVLDKNIHERVLSDLRGVVGFFFDSSRGDASSPAYLQLQHTISEVQSVIGEIEGGGQ